jgi:hypothetical protein
VASCHGESSLTLVGSWSRPLSRRRFRVIPSVSRGVARPVVTARSPRGERATEMSQPSVGEQRWDALHPPVHGEVVDLDPPLGEQLLHVPWVMTPRRALLMKVLFAPPPADASFLRRPAQRVSALSVPSGWIRRASVWVHPASFGVP